MSDVGTPNAARPRLFLIDGTALAYRAYFAMGRSGLSTATGEPTGAVFGVANTIWSLLKEHEPEYMAVVFDTSAPTFRHEEYTAYKANREAMPEDLARQLPLLAEMVRAWPLVCLAVDGVEADDVIGSYAVQLAGPDLEVIMVTGDKDFCQLVNDDISILNPGRGGPARVEAHRMDAAAVEAKFGVPPSQVIEVLSLMGDTSDNVPGVPGIGEKTAAQLIREFGSLETLLSKLDLVSRKSWAEKLREYAEQARLSHRLVTIRTSCPLPEPLSAMAVGRPSAALSHFFRRMEFGRLTRDAAIAAGAVPDSTAPATPPPAVVLVDREPVVPLPAGTPWGGTLDLFRSGEDDPLPVKAAGPWLTDPPPTDADYRLVTDGAGLEHLARELREARTPISLDTETTGLDPMRARLVGLSFATKAGTGWYVPVAHHEGPNVSLEEVQRVLGPILADPEVKKLGQNIKYDLVILERHGLPVLGVEFDTMVASYLIAAGRSHSLDNLAREELGYRMVPISDLIGKGQKQRSFAEVPLPLAVRYAAEDADITFRLAERFRPILTERDLDGLFTQLEMPLLLVLKEMEETGVALDVPFLAEMSGRLGLEIARLEESAHAVAGESFNLNSPIQLGKLLFEKLKLPAGRKTKTGWSTDSETLEDLVPQHELPKLLLEYRQLAKLKSTYVDALPRLVHPETGRVHSSFNQTVAATGRLSSSDPNLQNIPIRTPLGREVRRAFIAGGHDRLLISADYSQIELRIMAHLSGDSNLNDYFRRGVDVHRETAASIFGIPADQVSPDQRAQAKTVNFGILYGQGPVGLARQIGITREAAKQFIAAYKAQFPGVTEFLDRTVREATTTGFVMTLLKRRRYLPNLASPEGRFRAEAERMAINTPIQGTAADMIKMAMLAVDRELKRLYPEARLLLQVHDELVLEAPSGLAHDVAATVRRAMEEAIKLSVPVVVDVGVGPNWAGIH